MGDLVLHAAGAMVANPERRRFLRAAPAAAAAGFALAGAPLFAAPAADAPQAGTAKFQQFSAEEIENDIQKANAKPGNVSLIDGKGVSFTMVLTAEKAQTAPEFEYHEHRDHIFQILEGSTEYEVGGTPKGGRMIAPGEWRGAEVEGATKITLNKGDRLVIPRGTPHKRTTPNSVTLSLISPEGPALK